MLNDLNKAAWLMGTHVDVAYAQDQISSYSLFHNPSDGLYEDAFESAWDKGYLPRRRSYSHNVNHLAAVLRETQQRGHHTRWVVHSQGAIIFSKAVRLASQIYGGSFACHKVSVHGRGANLVTLRHACQLAGIEVVAVRNNPFDPVANVAGCNGLLGSGLARSLLCVDLVAGNNPLASPFTLGVSSAAAFGAALAIVLGIGLPGIPGQWFISANAFIFALLAALLLDGITRKGNMATTETLLIRGKSRTIRRIQSIHYLDRKDPDVQTHIL
jgi:hypothetical protein